MPIETYTITVYPNGYVSNSFQYASVDSSYPLTGVIGKAHTNSSIASRWYLTTGANSTSFVRYTFDLTDIPEEASITSITCYIKNNESTSSTSRISNKSFLLGTSTTYNKASLSSQAPTSSVKTYSVSGGTWIRSELNDILLTIMHQRGSSGSTTSYYTNLYGVSLIVTYTINVPVMYFKKNGSWSGAEAVYQKVSGVWTSVNKSIFNSSARYVHGNATKSLFEFPFSNESRTTTLLEMSSVGIIPTAQDVSTEYTLTSSLGQLATSAYFYLNNEVTTEHNIPCSRNIEAETKVNVYATFDYSIKYAYAIVNGSSRSLTITTSGLTKQASGWFYMPSQNTTLIIAGSSSGGAIM